MGSGNDTPPTDAPAPPAAGDAPADPAAKSAGRKIGRVLSAANERRIVESRDNLDTVLEQLAPAEDQNGPS